MRVVVVLTESECDKYPGAPCVMDVLGPFETREEADAVARSYPDWARPHNMVVHSEPGVRFAHDRTGDRS